MIEYKVETINDLCIKITDGSHFSPEHEETGEYQMYSVKDMDYNGFLNSDCKMIGKEMFLKLAKSDCRPLKNDILIAKDGSYLKCAFKVKEDLNACILSSIAILRPNIKNIDPDYFVYLMRSKTIKSAMANYVSGSALPRIILSDFKKMKLKMISNVEIQTKISTILSRYDEAIENNNKRIKLLEQMAQNLYKEWFVRFRFPGWENCEFENGIPKGWHQGKFSELFEFKRGKNITADEMIEGQVPVISAGISPSGYHIEANVKGTSLTISSSGANAGYLSIHYEDIWAADCMFITEENTKNIYYLYELLNNIRPVILNQQRGAAQPHVYSKDINNLRLWIPNEDLREKANKLLEPIHKEIYQLQQTNQNLAKQRDLLLPRLMSGKLEVEEI